jgi:hypothetical protein
MIITAVNQQEAGNTSPRRLPTPPFASGLLCFLPNGRVPQRASALPLRGAVSQAAAPRFLHPDNSPALGDCDSGPDTKGPRA